MLGWMIEEKAVNVLKSFDRCIDEQFEWILEALVEVKKALTQPDIHLLPKTPSEKKKHLRRKMGSRSAFTYHRISNKESANLRGSYVEIDVLSPRTPESSSKEINIKVYGQYDSSYDSGHRQSFKSEKNSQMFNHMPLTTSSSQRNGIYLETDYFSLNRELYAELCQANISSNQHLQNGFSDFLQLFDDRQISESVNTDCKGCVSISNRHSKKNYVIIPKCELQNIFRPEIVEALLPCTSNGSILIQNLIHKVDENEVLKSLVLTFTQNVQNTECDTSLCDLSIKGNVSYSLSDSNNCLPNSNVDEAHGSNRFLLDGTASSEVLQNTSGNENSLTVSSGIVSVVCENSEVLADKANLMSSADPNRGTGPNFLLAKFCGVQRISNESGSSVEPTKTVTKKRRSKNIAKSRRSSIIPGRKYVSQRQSLTKSVNLRKSQEKGQFYFSGKCVASSSSIFRGSRQENDKKMVSCIPGGGRLYRSPAVNSVAVKLAPTSVPKSRIQKLCRLFSPKSKTGISQDDTSRTIDLTAIPTSSSTQTFSLDKTRMKKGAIDKACVNKNPGESINSAFGGKPKRKPSAFVHCFSSPRRSSSIENAGKSKHQHIGFDNKTPNRFVKNLPISKPQSIVGAVEKSSANGLFRRLQGKVKPPTRELPSVKTQALFECAKLPEKKPELVFLTAGHIGDVEIGNVSRVDKPASLDEQEICQLVKDCYFLRLASNIPVPSVASNDTVLSYDIGDIAPDSDGSSTEDLDASQCREAPPHVIPLWAHGKRLASTIIEFHLRRVDGETVFGHIVDPDLNEMFEEKKPWFDKRTSSANWEQPLDAKSLLH